MPKHFEGEPVYHNKFISIKTGEEIILGDCVYAEELEKKGLGHYYKSISEATKDYYILWKVENGKIFWIYETYEEIKKEYDALIAGGMSEEDASLSILNTYGKDPVAYKRILTPRK